MKKILTVLLSAVMCLSATACAGKNSYIPYEVLTHKTSASGSTDITVLVKYAFSINAFEQALEKKFPDINLIQVGNYTSDMGIAEYAARMEHDDLTDIVMTWPLEVGKEFWADRLMDLSTLTVAKNYTIKSLNNVCDENTGKLYYLPGPSQVRGIIYNQTMFEENGWAVPSDFEGFVALCKEIEESGIRSLQLGLKNAEVLDTAFVGFGYGDCYAKPANAAAIERYNNGQGSLADNFTPALQTFMRLTDEGVLRAADLQVDYAEREKMLFSRKCAMVEDSVLLANMGVSITGTKDKFAMMPFFNPGEYNDWARLYPVCFIGANKKVQKDPAKYAAVVKILEYISTPEGQAALLGDNGAMFSNLKSVEAPDVPQIKDMKRALTAGRYGVFPTLKNAQNDLRKGLAGLLQAKQKGVPFTQSEIDERIDRLVKAVDEKNRNPSIVSPPLSVGAASSDFTLIETGNFVSDVLRGATETPIALFLDNGKDGLFNGKGISGRLYAGDITVDDLKRILPDYKYGETGELWKVTMTGENLLKTLEYSIAVDNDKTGWFYYFSGLRIEFAPLAPIGSRIKKVTDEQGNSIDPARVYTVTVIEDSVKNEYLLSCEKTGLLTSTVLEQRITRSKNRTVSPVRDNRFVVV